MIFLNKNTLDSASEITIKWADIIQKNILLICYKTALNK